MIIFKTNFKGLLLWIDGRGVSGWLERRACFEAHFLLRKGWKSKP
jgi:hypothetical protein